MTAGGQRGARRKRVTRRRGELHPARHGGRWGFIDSTGELAIGGAFLAVGAFSEGLAAAVSPQGLLGFVDPAGDWAVPPTFRHEPALLARSVFRQQLAPVCVAPGWWDYVSPGGARLGLALAEATAFSDGLAFVRAGPRWGFIDPTGAFALGPAWLPAQPQAPERSAFSGGYAVVRQDDGPRATVYLRPDGRPLLEAALVAGGPFSEGLASACADHARGYRALGADGRWAFAAPSPLGWLGDCREGLLAFAAAPGGLLGFLDRQGKVVVPPRFEATLGYSEGRAAVALGGRWGYLDLRGELVIEPNWAAAGDFRDGLAPVTDEAGRVGYLGREGAVVVEPA